MNTATYLLKLQPNQDLTDGIEAYLRAAGIKAVLIVDAVGSLVNAVLEKDGIQTHVTGPGLEVAGLSGTVLIEGTSSLYGYVCHTDMTVSEGFLVQGRNAVGVTFEIILQELDCSA